MVMTQFLVQIWSLWKLHLLMGDLMDHFGKLYFYAFYIMFYN